MTPEQFVFWLQGYVEVTGNPASTSTAPTDEQWKAIKDHLQTVFHKVTPDRTQPYIRPLEITPNGTGTPPWNNPNTIIC